MSGTITVMSEPQTWQRVPDGWPVAGPELVEHAKVRAMVALTAVTDRGPVERLVSYYDRAGNYAGATFTELHPNIPDDITAVDLHALTLMKVEVLAGGTRRLLEGNTHRPAILQALADVEHKDLLVAGPDDFLAMEQLYLLIRDVLSEPGTKVRNRWVTASKLCARKRWDLFPVRDDVVCRYLGLIPARGYGNYQVDWQVYRALIGDKEVTDTIDDLVDKVKVTPDRDVHPDRGRLRILDAALWMWAR